MAKRMAGDVFVKKWVTVLSVTYKPECRQRIGEAADAARSVLYFSFGSPDPGANVLIVENEIVEKEASEDLRDLASKDARGSSAMQLVQKLCQSHGLPVACDVQSVQELIRDVMVALPFAHSHETSFTNPKSTFIPDKA